MIVRRDVIAEFRSWWAKNVPPGTVISDPNWWADRIVPHLAELEGMFERAVQHGVSQVVEALAQIDTAEARIDDLTELVTLQAKGLTEAEDRRFEQESRRRQMEARIDFLRSLVPGEITLESAWDSICRERDAAEARIVELEDDLKECTGQLVSALKNQARIRQEMAAGLAAAEARIVELEAALAEANESIDEVCFDANQAKAAKEAAEAVADRLRKALLEVTSACELSIQIHDLFDEQWTATNWPDQQASADKASANFIKYHGMEVVSSLASSASLRKEAKELAKKWRVTNSQIGQGSAGNKARRTCAAELLAAIELTGTPVADGGEGL